MNLYNILHRRSKVSGHRPTRLVDGEFFIQQADKLILFKDSVGGTGYILTSGAINAGNSVATDQMLFSTGNAVCTYLYADNLNIINPQSSGSVINAGCLNNIYTSCHSLISAGECNNICTSTRANIIGGCCNDIIFGKKSSIVASNPWTHPGSFSQNSSSRPSGSINAS